MTRKILAVAGALLLGACSVTAPLQGMIDGGEWWRLITTGFLHASFFHVAFNMVFIWFIGRSLEPAIGSARFVVAYGASLLCGSFGVLLLEPNSVAVGASGAAFGLMGALIVEARSRHIDLIEAVLDAELDVRAAASGR